MTQELIPLKPGQHPVTRLPRFTTELPFFYFTKRKDLLTQPVNFQATDAADRPIRWKVTPNISPTIGAPGIEAHQVWVKLVKPAIDEQRRNDGSIPPIVPLGSARRCLSLLGWKTGGWEARDFLKAVHQIGSAWCEADFWLPTLKTDEDGKPAFRRIKAAFSRLSLYAVGETHFTEEEIQNGKTNFDFDLEDTVYIQLHPIELEIQRNEGQRLVDNEYLFSVSPAERRWYELLAPKFYGVTRNIEQSPGYCEIRYSWYIARHHTLKQHTEKKRVVQQMNDLIHDHMQFGYVLRVDYRAYRQEGEPDDFIIRYYPGEFAQITAARILARLRQQKRKESRAVQIPLPIDAPPIIVEIEAPEEPAALTAEEETLVRKLCEIGITEEKAEELVTKSRGAVERELEALPERNKEGIKDLAAWLVRAIERGNYSQPKNITEKRAREKKRKADEAEKALEMRRQSHEKRFGAAHSAYVWQRVGEIKKTHPEAYRAFEEATAEEREKAEKTFRDMPNLTRKVLEGALVNHFRNHPECPILDFWQWDAVLNPEPSKL